MATAKTMLLIKNSELLLLLVLFAAALSAEAFGLQRTIQDDIARRLNATHTNAHASSSGLASMFSPRMDFEQWKPLTGRGDPLHNDPTYDYEPPVLERVHYWADDSKLEREPFHEKKSEVLMLGVSSRKPSVTSRQPPLPPPRRHNQFRPPQTKYEDFTYKLSDTYPMTILVPPPPPPPGHKPSLFILDDEETPLINSHIIDIISSPVSTKDTTKAPEKLTSTYALQEANLIYQSSSTSQNWILDTNDTLPHNINNAVSSDYAGWGPTTPFDVYETANETHNLVSNDHVEVSKHPYSFYKPMLSEAPPPPPVEKDIYLHISTFLPTALPPTSSGETTTNLSETTWPTEQTTYETTIASHDYYEDTPTEKPTTLVFRPTHGMSNPTERPSTNEAVNLFSMLGPMMSMPILNGPDRPEDNLYAHASESMQVFKERHPEDVMKLENMQTMQPPPPVILTESTTASHKQPYQGNPNIIGSLQQNKPSLHTHDPYLHMRYTTPVPKTSADTFDKNKSTTEPSAPMYLIIQGHSKVKTYSSKPKPGDDNINTKNNEILKPNETNEVKHLHPKDKFAKKLVPEVRKSKAQNLKALLDHGTGSIEIQETDLGIQYDVSDGSDVPLELYRKGIVYSDENDYKSAHNKTQKRDKRQIDLEDLIPFDEDTIEEFVYNFFEGKKNETSFTGLIAQAVTSDAANAVDELEDDEDSGEVKETDEER